MIFLMEKKHSMIKSKVIVISTRTDTKMYIYDPNKVTHTRNAIYTVLTRRIIPIKYYPLLRVSHCHPYTQHPMLKLSHSFLFLMNSSQFHLVLSFKLCFWRYVFYLFIYKYITSGVVVRACFTWWACRSPHNTWVPARRCPGTPHIPRRASERRLYSIWK